MLMETAVHDPAVVTDELLQQKLQMAKVDGSQKSFPAHAPGFCWLEGLQLCSAGRGPRHACQGRSPRAADLGGNDKFVSVDHADAVRDGPRNATLIVFDECGHLPQIEHAERFNSDVLEFLSGQQARREEAIRPAP